MKPTGVPSLRSVLAMRSAILLLTLLATACATQANLAYTPPEERRSVPYPAIATVRVTDDAACRTVRWAR